MQANKLIASHMFYAKIVPFSLFMYTAQFHSCPQKVDLAFDQSLA